MERLLADIMFFASDYQGQQFVIDEAYVNEKLSDMIDDRDLSKFML
jgi:ATP-dependent HslUV protease ATP-binding subunit HslU